MVPCKNESNQRDRVNPLRKLVARACCLGLYAGCALAQAPLEAPPAPRFDIGRFVVEGNTLLPKAEVEALVQPFAGKSRDFGDVQRALEALQDAYLERGYSAVRVMLPEQELNRGEVRMQVVDATLRMIRVEGNKLFDTANVRRGLPTLKEGASPNTHRIGENIQLANENPAKQVNVRLEAADEEGKVDAVVRVTEDSPVRYSAFVDSSGNAQTGYYRIGAGYMNANMRDRDEMLTLQLITSPDHLSDVLIFGAGYRIPVYATGGAIEAVLAYSDVNSGTVPGLLSVSGAGTIFGLRYSQVLPRIEAYEQKASIGIDYRAFRQNVTRVGGVDKLLPDITVRPLTLAYAGRYSRVGREVSVSGSYSKNFPGGGDSDQAAFDGNRANARSAYSIWRLGGGWTEALPRDFLLRGAFNWQYTWDRLTPVEQFGMGGADSVRGYNEREVASDKGHRVSVEGYSPDFGERIGGNWKARALAFVDWARGRDVVPERDNQNGKNGLASVGLGARLNEGKALSLRVDWAHALNAAGTRPEGKDKVFFSIAYTFQ